MSFQTRRPARCVAAASAVVYVLVRNQLRGQVDDALRERAAFVTRRPLGSPTRDRRARPPSAGPAGPGLEPGDVFVQAVRDDGSVASPDPIRPSSRSRRTTLAAARGERKEFFSDATVAGTHVRMLTVPLGQGYALQLVRPLDEVDQLLDRVGLVMIFVALAGIGVAALLGALVARAALARYGG